MNKRMMSLAMLLCFAAMTPLFANYKLLVDNEGTYLISSADDYEEFRKMVEDGNPYANAVLGADITVSKPIGSGDVQFHYRGTFDGKGHTVTLNNMVNDSQNATPWGLFQYTEPGCVIRNLKVSGQIKSSHPYIGSIVGEAKGTVIENCISDATVGGGKQVAGLVGAAKGVVQFNRCAFIGTISGSEDCHGIVAYCPQMATMKSCYVAADFRGIADSGSSQFTANLNPQVVPFRNNYYYNKVGQIIACNQVGAATEYTSKQDITGGRLCYRLNREGLEGIKWYQVGDYPYPFKVDGAKVACYKDLLYLLVDEGECKHNYVSGGDFTCRWCNAKRDVVKNELEPLQDRYFSNTGEGYVDYINYTIDKSNWTAKVTGIRNREGIKAVHIPESINVFGGIYTVTEIANRGLYKSEMEYCYIPKSVTKIDDNAFNLCGKLKELYIADGPTNPSIYLGRDEADGKELFYDSPDLTTVYFGRNVSWNSDLYRDAPFEDRKKLKNVFWGPGVERVGNARYGDDPRNGHNCELFDGCELGSVYFMGSDKSLNTTVNVFNSKGLSNATYYYMNHDFTANSYTSYSTVSTGSCIIDRAKTVEFGPLVTFIPEKMYSGSMVSRNTVLENLDFNKAKRLKTIKKSAFAYINGQLKKVDLSGATSLEEIGEEAFYYLNHVPALNLGNCVKRIGKSAFNTGGFMHIHIPASVENLGYKAFYDCAEALDLIIEPSDKELKCETYDGECRTFTSSKNLTNFYLGRNVVWTSDEKKSSPFYDSYFKNIVIDNAVTQLHPYMFQHNNKLKSLNIGSGVTVIPDNCFNESEGVVSLILADGDSPITLNGSCKPLKVETMYVGRTIADPTNTPHGDKAMALVQYGPRISTVWSKAMVDCPNLKNVILPAGVTVESEAFVSCDINEMYAYGDATFKTNAVKDCNSISELTVIGKLTMEKDAFAPSGNFKAVNTINVFFKEDPKDESHAQSFPQKYLEESVLNNLFDTAYDKVEFTCLPWSGFKNRNTFQANDFAPTADVVARTYYDHALIRNEHKANQYFAVRMPFNVSTYYFGSDAKAYSLQAGHNGVLAISGDGETNITIANAENLDRKLSFEVNEPYLICSPHDDAIIQASIDHFKERSVFVDLGASKPNGVIPVIVNNEDRTVSPQDGNLYVLEDGLLKKVNGSHQLTAFNLCFNPKDDHRLHFLNTDGSKLIKDATNVTPMDGLMGYASFYSNESHHIVEGAQVYTVCPTTTSENKPALMLKPVSDNVVNKGEAVLVRYLPGQTLSMQMATNPSADADSYKANILKGVDHDTNVSDLGEIFVLGLNTHSIGFFPTMAIETGECINHMLSANRAYISSADADKSLFPYVVDVDTSIRGFGMSDDDSIVFDTNGRRVIDAGKRTVYIRNGRKFINK